MKTDKIDGKILMNGQKTERPISLDAFYSMFLHRHKKDFYFSGEMHEPWEMVYVQSGNVGITADDRIYHLGVGSIVFHKPMEFHQIWSESDDVRIFVTSFKLSGRLASNLFNKVFKLKPNDIILIDTLLKESKCLYSCETGRTYNQFSKWGEQPILVAQLVYRLELLLLNLLTYTDQKQMPESSALYSKIVRILEANINRNITIEQISKLCDVSPTSVKNCFNKYTGGGIHKYFLKLKIRNAIALLGEGFSVGNVSEQLGFNNSNYFTYVFRRETGKCPSDYKP